MMRPQLPSIRIASCLLAAALLLPAMLSATSPWEVIENLRSAMEKRGPTTAQFTQRYLPAGFSQAERESGSLALNLPHCLRWDYEQPDSKGFLICDATAFSWTEGDPVGYRYTLDPKREPGLDLLLLELDQLRLRYRAENREEKQGIVEVTLRPVEENAQLTRAVILIDTVTQKLIQLEYTDSEGNQTSFDLLDYGALESGESHFRPPSGIEWREE